MKKSTFIVVALAVALVFAFAATAHATSAKTFNWSTDYYTWGTWSGAGVEGSGTRLSDVGLNPTNPGVHGNYLATTAKCGICHSVHRAAGDGVTLLATDNPTCAGCHAVGSTVTELTVNWGNGGPHGSASLAGCQNRACHMSNPHGAGGSEYTIVAAKLLNPETDVRLADAVDAPGSGITTADVMAEATSDWDETTRSAVRTGYNCNLGTCHYQTLLAVLEEGWAEDRRTHYDPGYEFVEKTGHLTVAAANDETAFTPVESCISCHDQTDSLTGNGQTTISGYTFPHGQVPSPGSVNNTDDSRAFLWYTYAGNAEGDDAGYFTGVADKAFDGACLKCHRSGDSGIGLTH